MSVVCASGRGLLPIAVCEYPLVKNAMACTNDSGDAINEVGITLKASLLKITLAALMGVFSSPSLSGSSPTHCGMHNTCQRGG